MLTPRYFKNPRTRPYSGIMKQENVLRHGSDRMAIPCYKESLNKDAQAKRALPPWNNPIIQDSKIVRRTAFRKHRPYFFKRHSPPCQHTFLEKGELELRNKRLPEMERDFYPLQRPLVIINPSENGFQVIKR